jgi:hypothetical protein
MRSIGTSVAVLWLTLMHVQPAAADELWLLSGDTITGTAQVLDKGVLTFKPPYADAVKVPWKQVAGLETIRQVRVTSRGAGPQIARVVPGPQGYLRLQTDTGSSVDVRLPDIVTIIRPPSGIITTARAETGLIVSSGASDNSNLHLLGAVMWRTPLQQTALDIEVNHAQSQGIETTRNLTSTFRHQEFLTDRVFANGNVIVTSDHIRDLTLRVAPGVGLGYQVVRYGLSSLAVDGGFSYVNERRGIDPDRRFLAARESLKLERFLLPGRLQLFHQDDAYVGLTGDENSFVRTRSGARLMVVGGMIMTGELGLNWDERPPAGIAHVDRTFAITLGYQLGF